jgi:hypothetical protein
MKSNIDFSNLSSRVNYVHFLKQMALAAFVYLWRLLCIVGHIYSISKFLIFTLYIMQSNLDIIISNLYSRVDYDHLKKERFSCLCLSLAAFMDWPTTFHLLILDFGFLDLRI